jgi:hypothetical protein
VPVTIGRPIANVQTYVLDRALGLAASGAHGELAIGGEGVARGYLGQPALTAERFRPDPFSGRPGARLYLSGDVALAGADGELRCLGRRDRQVKLRGFRVEPGEVEAALGQTPGVAEAAVEVSGEGDDARLVAYVVPRPGVALDGPALRASLRGRLPEHMLPGVVVSLGTLPRTPAGKLDRRALPAAEAQAQTAAPLVPVESDLERRVAAIWCDVLKLERVGAEQAFFDLGGHSLLLVRVHARLEAELGRRLPLMLLFAHPTVRSLAAALSGGTSQDSLEGSHERAGRRREAAGTRRLARQAARTRLVAHGEDR